MTRRRTLALCMTGAVLATSLPPGAAWSQSLSELFKKVRGSVVVIATEESMPAVRDEQGNTKTASGLGSGFLISTDGKIMTAAHVVHLADRIVVRFADGEVVPARVVSSVPTADVALLQAERVPTGMPVAPLADSDSLEVGDPVFVVGAPYGLTYSLSSGLVSARHEPNRSYSGFVQAELLQTDAAINKGNSGGPMFNMQGKVVGVVSHILSQSGGFEGLGFAVSSNVAAHLLLEERRIWGGVDGAVVSGDLAKALNVPIPVGYLVQRVAKGSFGDALGLQGGTFEAKIGDETYLLGGDIMLDLMGVSMAEEGAEAMIDRRMTDLRPGTEVSATVWRWGKKVTLTRRWYPDNR